MANPLGDYKARQAARAVMKQENQRRLGAVQAEFSRRQAERADTIARSAGDYATPEGEIDESLGRAGTYGGKFLRGLGSTVASVPRAAADVTQLATGYDPEFLRSAGQGIEDFANQADVNPEYADEFGGKVAGALGTATGFLAGGVVGGGVKAAGYGAASLAAKAALPVSSGISEMTEDFRRTTGRDPTQAELAKLVPIGTGLGAMEYLPVGRALGRFGKATAGTGNKLRKNKGYIAQEGAKGFAEEAVQESAQTVAQDFAAKQMYDEDREVLAGLEEAATVGGTTGFLMNAALVAAGVKLRSGKPNDDQKENMKNAVAEDEDFRKNAVKDSEKLVGLQKEAADLNVQIATAKAAEGSSPEAVAALEEKRNIVVADMKGLMQAGVALPQDLEGTVPRDEDTLADVGYDVEEAGIPGVGTQEENDLYDLLDREAEQAQLDQDAANIEVEEFEGAPYVGGLDVDEMTVEEIDIPVVRSMKEMLRTTEEELEARKNPQTPVAATIEPEQKEELRAAQTEVKKKTKKAKKAKKGRGLPSAGAAKAGKEKKPTTTKRSPLPTAPAERGARTAETLDKVEKVRKKVAKRKPVQADLTPVANEIRQEISDWADQKGKMDAKEFRGGMNQLRMRLTNEMRSQYTPEELTAQKLREIGKEITSYIKEITPSAAMIKANKEGAESAKPTTAESLKAELLGLTGAEESEDGSVSIPTDMTGTVEGPEQFKEVVENQRLSGVRKSKQDLGQTNTQENWNAYISSVVALVNSKLKVTGEHRPAEARLETRNVLEQLSNEGLLDPKLVGQEANIAVEAAKFGETKQKEVAELVTQLETQYPLKENGKGREVKEPLVITRGEVEAYNTALKELGLYGRTLKTKNKGASYELRLVNKNKHIKEGQEPLQVLYNAPSFTTFTPEDMEKMATEPDVGAPPEKATPLYNEEEAAKAAPVTNPLTGEPTAAEQIPTAEEVDDTVEELARITPTQINRMRKADVTKALVDLGGFYEEELPATVPERKKLLKEAIGEAQDYVNQVPADTTPTAPADTGGGILGRPMRATPGVPEFGKESQRPAIERGEEETATVDPAKNPFDYEGATPRLESGDALEEASETAQSSTEEKFFSGEKMSKKDMDNLVNSMHDDLYSNEIDDTLEAPPLDYSSEAWSESGAAVLKVLDRESQTGTPTQFSHILEVLRDTLPKGSSEEALVKILLSKNLRTTIEIVNTLDGAEGRAIGGDYNVDRQHIRLNRQQMPSDISQVLVHEGVHAVTSHMYRTDPAFKEQIDLLYQAAQVAYTKHKRDNGVTGIDGVDYGMSSPEEFLAEMFANPLMQRFANSVQYNSGKWGKLANIFRAFVDTIRMGLGMDVKENTVLYQTLVTGYRGMRTQNQIDQMTQQFDVENVPIEMLDPFYEDDPTMGSTVLDFAARKAILKKTEELRNIVDAGKLPRSGEDSLPITMVDLTEYTKGMEEGIRMQIENGDVVDHTIDLARVQKQGYYIDALIDQGFEEGSVTVQRELHNLIQMMENIQATAAGETEVIFNYRSEYISEYQPLREDHLGTQAVRNLWSALKKKEQSGNYLTPSEVNFLIYSEMGDKQETFDRMFSFSMDTLNAPPISEAPVPDTGEEYLVGGTAEKQYTAEGKRIPRPFTSKAYSHEDMVQTMKGAAKITQQSIDSAHGIAAKAASQWHTYLRNMKPFTGYRLLKDMVDQRAYLAGRNVSMGNASTFDEMANFFARSFNNLQQREMELLTDYMTKREGNINLVPERIRGAALSAKENIIAMGDELVRLGVLDENIHNTTKGSYLGRMYLMFMSLPNEKGQVSTTGGTGAKTSLMEYMKKRSLKDADLQELYGFINDPAMRTASTISKVGRDIGIFRFMENINTFSQMQGENPWVFPDMEEKFQLTILNREGVEEEFQKPLTIPDALDALRQMEKNVVKHGFQKEEAEGAETMTAGYIRLNRDRINEVLTTMQTERAESLTDPAEREQFEQGNFAELDITKYTKLAENGRNGKLSGKWIRNEIYNDLRSNTFAFSTENASTAEKLLGQNSALTKGNKIWKATKTIYNLPAHPRNFVSNFINFDTSTDTSTLEVMRMVYETAKEWYVARTKDGLKYPNDPIWRLADSSGMTEATWTAQESIQFGNDWQYEKREGKESGWMRMLPDGGFKDHMSEHLPHMSGRGVAFLSKIAQVYQGNETIFRVAKLKDELTKLKKANPNATPMEIKALEQVAVQQANEAIFDYTNVTQSVKYFRNAPIGAPFISFSYLAAPRIMENVAKHPIKMMKYITLPYLMGEFAASMGAFDGDDWETAKNQAPGFLKDKHTLMPMPWKDEEGKNIVWDLSYYLPYAPFLETAHQYKNIMSGADTETGVLDPVIRNFGILSGPVPDIITAAKSGMDPFTQQPIVDPNGGTGDKALDVLMYGWGVAAPTFLTHHGLLGNMYKQATNKGNINPRTGGERTSLTEGILRGFGTSVYSYDADDSRGVNARYYASLLNQQKAADKRKLKQMVAEGASFEKIAKERRSSAERQTIYRNNYQSYLEETQ